MMRLLSRPLICFAALHLALIGVAAGLVALSGGVFFALQPAAGSAAAAVAAGVTLLMFSLIAVLTAVIFARSKPPAAAAPLLPQSADAGKLGSLLGQQFAALAREHQAPTMGGALLAGFAVGASPELRRLLKDLILR